MRGVLSVALNISVFDVTHCSVRRGRMAIQIETKEDARRHALSPKRVVYRIPLLRENFS